MHHHASLFVGGVCECEDQVRRLEPDSLKWLLQPAEAVSHFSLAVYSGQFLV